MHTLWKSNNSVTYIYSFKNEYLLVSKFIWKADLNSDNIEQNKIVTNTELNLDKYDLFLLFDSFIMSFRIPSYFICLEDRFIWT